MLEPPRGKKSAIVLAKMDQQESPRGSKSVVVFVKMEHQDPPRCRKSAILLVKMDQQGFIWVGGTSRRVGQSVVVLAFVLMLPLLF